MDYSKSGGPKRRPTAPKHGEHKVQEPKGKQPPKEALLARMKAAAQAKAAK